APVVERGSRPRTPSSRGSVGGGGALVVRADGGRGPRARGGIPLPASARVLWEDSRAAARRSDRTAEDRDDRTAGRRLRRGGREAVVALARQDACRRVSVDPAGRARRRAVLPLRDGARDRARLGPASGRTRVPE